MTLSGNPSTIDLSREHVVAEVYETILDPRRYDKLMEAWAAHLEAADATAAEDPILAAHFRRACDLADRIGRRNGSHSVAEMEDIAVLIGASGTILEASAAAIALFQASNAGAFELRDILDRTSGDGATQVRNALSCAKSARGTLLTVITLALEDGETGHAALSAVGDDTVLLRMLSLEWTPRTEAVLKTAFSLSPAEIAVTRDLCRGHAIRDIAEQRERSLHTVRGQLKAILRKTGATTQADLVRLVSTLGRFTDADGADTLPAQAIACDGGFIRAARDEILGTGGLPCVHTLGPKDGRPAVFIHGMLDGTSITPEAEALLYRHNIRLIAPVRLGFGEAPAPGEAEAALDAFAHDLDTLITAERMVRPVLIGHMSGAPYAYAAAMRMGDRVGGIVSVSGGVPLVSVGQIRAMTPRQKTVALTARFTPGLLPGILRAGMAQIDHDDSPSFMHALYPKGSHDRRVAEGIMPLLYDGYRFAVAKGYRGFEVDSHHVVRDWSALTHDCPVQALHVHGAHDSVVRIDSVRDFCATHDHAELLEYAECGQLIFYEKPAFVLDAVVRLMRD